MTMSGRRDYAPGMPETRQPPASWGELPPLADTIWPAASATDSDLQRRKKLGVRSGHLAMAALVGAAVLGTVAVESGRMPGVHLAGFLTAAVAYLAWNLVGTRGAVGLLLWEGEPPPPLAVRLPRGGAGVYFGVQLALAGTVYWLGDRGRVPNLVWLALLPPVAYSVFLLDRPGITGVTVLTLGLFLVSGLRWHGWTNIGTGLAAFSFALLFTLVFTLLIVSAEKARNRVQALAAELGAANRQLREYAVHAGELAVTRERNRLAREIHDSLGHYLTVVNVQIQAAQALETSDPARARAALDQARALTQAGLREVRESVAALRSSPLDNRRLAEALEVVVGEHRAAGLDCQFTILGTPRPLAPAAALTLYRAGQEGLTNVEKHARANRAALVVDFRSPGTVSLRVEDDGVGVPENAGGPAGFGLLGLRERTQLLGGRVEVTRTPGAGFTLEVQVPG